MRYRGLGFRVKNDASCWAKRTSSPSLATPSLGFRRKKETGERAGSSGKAARSRKGVFPARAGGREGRSEPSETRRRKRFPGEVHAARAAEQTRRLLNRKSFLSQAARVLRAPPPVPLCAQDQRSVQCDAQDRRGREEDEAFAISVPKTVP